MYCGRRGGGAWAVKLETARTRWKRQKFALCRIRRVDARARASASVCDMYVRLGAVNSAIQIANLCTRYCQVPPTNRRPTGVSPSVRRTPRSPTSAASPATRASPGKGRGSRTSTCACRCGAVTSDVFVQCVESSDGKAPTDQRSSQITLAACACGDQRRQGTRTARSGSWEQLVA